jgi:hypothetical protein
VTKTRPTVLLSAPGLKNSNRRKVEVGQDKAVEPPKQVKEQASELVRSQDRCLARRMKEKSTITRRLQPRDACHASHIITRSTTRNATFSRNSPDYSSDTDELGNLPGSTEPVPEQMACMRQIMHYPAREQLNGWTYEVRTWECSDPENCSSTEEHWMPYEESDSKSDVSDNNHVQEDNDISDREDHSSEESDDMSDSESQNHSDKEDHSFIENDDMLDSESENYSDDHSYKEDDSVINFTEEYTSDENYLTDPYDSHESY